MYVFLERGYAMLHVHLCPCHTIPSDIKLATIDVKPVNTRNTSHVWTARRHSSIRSTLLPPPQAFYLINQHKQHQEQPVAFFRQHIVQVKLGFDFCTIF